MRMVHGHRVLRPLHELKGWLEEDHADAQDASEHDDDDGSRPLVQVQIGTNTGRYGLETNGSNGDKDDAGADGGQDLHDRA